MLIIVAREINPQVGTKFIKYYMVEGAYNKGKVTKFDGATIEVDFGDTIYEFSVDVCSVVFDAANNEHLMTCDEGRLIKDLHPRRNRTINTDDLLDFSWMDSPSDYS